VQGHRAVAANLPSMDDVTDPSRVTIERRPEGLVVTMRVPRSGCVITFLGTWLCAWAVAELAGVMGLVESAGRLGPDTLFVVVWLAAWTAAGVGAGSFLALMLNGREHVTLAPAGLTRRIEAFGIGRTWTYDPALVEDLRVMDGSRGSGAFFGFDYKGQVRRWGSGLTRDDAHRIVEEMLEYSRPKG
jgi:hypothetical protein